MRHAIATAIVLVLLLIVLWIFWSFPVALFVVGIFAIGILVTAIMPQWAGFFRWILIAGIILTLLVPFASRYYRGYWPLSQEANNKRQKDLDRRAAEGANPAMGLSQRALYNTLKSLDIAQAQKTVQKTIEIREKGLSKQQDALTLSQEVAQIHSLKQVYKEMVDASNKGTMIYNLLTTEMQLKINHDYPLFNDRGSVAPIPKIKGGTVVRVYRFIEQNPTSQHEADTVFKPVPSGVRRAFRTGTILYYVYLDDENGLPVAGNNREGWLPAEAFAGSFVVKVINDPPADKTGFANYFQRFADSGNRVRWGSFLAVVVLMAFGYWAAGKWLKVKHQTLSTVCRIAAILLICLAAWSYIIGPFGQAALAGESSRQKSPTPPAKLIGQNNQGGDTARYTPEPSRQPEHGGQIILTSSQELVDGLELKDNDGALISGHCQIYWHEGSVIWNKAKDATVWAWILPYGNHRLDANGREKRFVGVGQFKYPKLPAYCVVVSQDDQVNAWPKNNVVSVAEGINKTIFKINAPLKDEDWGSDQWSIVLEVVK